MNESFEEVTGYKHPFEKFEFLLKDPTVDRWLRFKEAWTKHNYLRCMRKFLEFTGPELGIKEPSALVAWAKSRPDNIEVQDIIEKFGERQPETGKQVRMSMVRSFLKRNGIGLPSMAGQKQVLKEYHRGYSREELQSLLGYLDQPLQKLFVLFGKDSGLRAQDLLSLRYRHVKRDLEAGKDFVHLYLEPAFYNRRKASGITFIGPNTVKLLKQLIEQKLVSKESDARIFPFTYPTIAGSLLIAKRKANLDPVIQPNHGLRKFFENCLDRLGMDVHKKLQLEGHSLGVRLHYTDRETEELRRLYQQAYQYLDLSEEAAADSRLKDFESRLTAKENEIKALKNELIEQKKLESFVRELMANPKIQKILNEGKE